VKLYYENYNYKTTVHYGLMCTWWLAYSFWHFSKPFRNISNSRAFELTVYSYTNRELFQAHKVL